MREFVDKSLCLIHTHMSDRKVKHKQNAIIEAQKLPLCFFFCCFVLFFVFLLL